MKKTSKFLSIMLAFILCACSITVGVWALLSQGGMGVGGQVTFYGNGVNATVSGYFSGYQDSTNPIVASSQTIVLPFLTFKPDATSETGTDDNISGWNNQNLQFCYDGTPITLNITVINISKIHKLYIKVVDMMHGANPALTTRVVNVNGSQSEVSNLATLNEASSSQTLTTFKVIFSPTTESGFTGNVINYNLNIKLSTEPLSAVDKDDVFTETGKWTGREEHFVYMGMYPQRFVNNNPINYPPLNAVATGKNLSVKLSYNFPIYYDEATARSFVFINNIRVVHNWNSEVNSGGQFSDGTTFVGGTSAWFEISPLKWLVLGYYAMDGDNFVSSTSGNTVTYSYTGRYDSSGNENTSFNPKQDNISLNLVCDVVICGMGINANSSLANGAAWTKAYDSTVTQESDARNYLNGIDENNDSHTFKKQTFSSIELEQMRYGLDNVTADGSKNITGINTKISDDGTCNQAWQNNSNDKVWLLSFDEVANYQNFSAGRNNSVTMDVSKAVENCDFAIATFSYNTAADYWKNCASWWTRSAFASSLVYDFYDSGAFINGDDCRAENLSLRPAILVTI